MKFLSVNRKHLSPRFARSSGSEWEAAVFAGYELCCRVMPSSSFKTILFATLIILNWKISLWCQVTNFSEHGSLQNTTVVPLYLEHSAVSNCTCHFPWICLWFSVICCWPSRTLLLRHSNIRGKGLIHMAAWYKMGSFRVRFFKRMLDWIFKSERSWKRILSFFTKQINPRSFRITEFEIADSKFND